MTQPGDDIVKEFLVESYEGLDRLDRDFVALENEPDSRELLASVFRTIHTIKGTCGFLGFHRLEAVAHAGEGVLSHLRDGSLALRPDITTSLLAMVDAVRRILARIEAAGEEGEEAYGDIIAALWEISSSVPAKTLDPRALSDFAPPSPPPAPAPPPPAAEIHDAYGQLHEAASIDLTESDATATAHEDAHVTSLADGNVRVDVNLLDRLVTLVSELVLTRNQIVQIVTRRDHAALPATAQRLNLITTELQEGILRTRMQPIGNLWNKLPRLVRDVASACSKNVRIELEGGETELDKTVLEAIRDPLTHVVRNAIDHGIENPGIRAACRKPAQGRLLLHAFHEGGYVFIELSDDGGGLPIERIRRTALERKIVTRERAAAMTDRDWARLIFLPGFSTAQSVTSISGRGVGMDVVKTNIERIGGSVDVQSQPTIGTTIFMKIPLTLAIVPALIVHDDGERFAIPQVSLLELLRLDATHAPRMIEWVHEAPVLRVRDQLLPLVFLRELMHERRAFSSSSLAARDGSALHVVVLNAEGRAFGLIVDGIDDAEEIVVKPLADPLKDISILAGATILGDGRVGLILDIPGIARASGLTAVERPLVPVTPPTAAPMKAAALLVVEVRSGWRVALPLSRVTRLEEIARPRIERSGDRDVLQYRGGILTLERLARLLDAPGPDEPWGDTVHAVVFEQPGRPLALTVSSIVDIVDEPAAPRPVTDREGISATAVIEGRVVDLLDLDAVMARLEHEQRGQRVAKGA
jgi:two-component system chemotaxis sensor kinase CheA